MATEYVKPAKGTPGGAKYGTYTKFGMGMPARAKQQKGAAAKPGAGAWGLGFDIDDPNVDESVTKWLAKHQRPDGTFVDNKGNPSNWLNNYYRQVIAENPGIRPVGALDMAFRMQYGESAKPPKNFFTEYLLDPLVSVALGAIPVVGPLAATGYGIGRGASENGLLGAITGGIGGLAAGKFGANLVQGISSAGGVGNYIGNLGTSAYNAATNLPSTLSQFGSNALDFAKYGPELTNINVPGIMPLDIVARAEPILNSLEPFIPAAYSGRGVTQAGLLASEPLRNVNQFMPPDVAARAGTSSVFPAGPPTLEQLAGRGGDAVDPVTGRQRPRFPSFGDSGGMAATYSATGGGLGFGPMQPITKREFMPLYQGDYGTLQGLLQQQANQTLSNFQYSPQTRRPFTSGLLG